MTSQFAGEEMEPGYGYLSGYKLKGITEQTSILRQLFPGVASRFFLCRREAATAQCRRTSKGGSPSRSGRPSPRPTAKPWRRCSRRSTRRARSRTGAKADWAPTTSRSARTSDAFETLAKQQKDHEIRVVAAQFGLRHRGRSVRGARECLRVNEVGRGACAVGIMLLSPPRAPSRPSFARDYFRWRTTAPSTTVGGLTPRSEAFFPIHSFARWLLSSQPALS